MKRTILAAAAIAAVLLPAAAQANTVSALGISIQSCVVNQRGDGSSNGINVVYVNTHPSPALQVNFLIGYRGHRYVLVDNGTFSQGSQINHNLTNTLVGFGWSGPTPNLCTVNKVILSNGRVLTPQNQ